MASSPEQEIRELRSAFWSDRDPDGRAFAPLADAYRRSGDLPQAIELLEDGLDRHPGFASGHLVAAWVHRDRGALEEAEACLRTVLQLDAENGEALRGLGELAAERGRDQEALAWLRRLEALEPGNVALARRIEEIEWASSALGGAEAAREGAADASTSGSSGDRGFDPETAGSSDELALDGPLAGPSDELALDPPAAGPSDDAAAVGPADALAFDPAAIDAEGDAALDPADVEDPFALDALPETPSGAFELDDPATGFDDLSLDGLPPGGPPRMGEAVRVETGGDVGDTHDVLGTDDVVRDADEIGEVRDEDVRVGEPEPAEPWGLEGLEGGVGAAEAGAVEPARDGAAAEPDTAEAAGPLGDSEDPGAGWAPERTEGHDADSEEEAEGEDGEGVLTRTMAELYVRQGLHERALRVYETLAEREPDDAELRGRIESLRERVAAMPAEPDPAASPPPALPSTGSGPAGLRRPDDDRAEEELETLARDWAEGPGAQEEVTTPFAWSDAEEVPEAEEEPEGEPVTGYFARLLEWQRSGRADAETPPSHPSEEGGASSDGLAASGTEAAADVAEGFAGFGAAAAAVEDPIADAAGEALGADDALLDAGDVALDPPGAGDGAAGAADPAAGAATTDEPVVDVGDLAPDTVGGEDPVVDVADLAPDASAAEDPVVDVADLAPDAPAAEGPVVDIADLAPDAEGSEDPEPSGDAFSRWLDRIR